MPPALVVAILDSGAGAIAASTATLAAAVGESKSGSDCAATIVIVFIPSVLQFLVLFLSPAAR